MNIKRILKLLAPYFAVGVFWCLFDNAWLAILAYHVQILIWSGRSLYGGQRIRLSGTVLLALPIGLAGPLFYFLLPYITQSSLTDWLNAHQLSRLSLLAMIPYFGLLHPFIEQLYWAPLRRSTPWAHPIFAGYHLLVLYSLLILPWVIISFILLPPESFLWQLMESKSGSLTARVISHILADFGVVVVAWLKI